SLPDWGIELVRSTVADTLETDPELSLFTEYRTGNAKTRRLATWILAGFLTGALFNESPFHQMVPGHHHAVIDLIQVA
ncbi:MAG: hypothetical protein WCL39_12870, partial [Armatimonadota bacterium]